MRTVTRMQFTNAKKLLELMQSLPESRVALETYHRRTDCGTIACTLGHAAQIPFFQNQGLKMRFHEEPHLDGIGYPSWHGQGPSATAQELFGTQSWVYLFSRREFSPYDEELDVKATDKEAAISRLQQWIADATVED